MVLRPFADEPGAPIAECGTIDWKLLFRGFTDGGSILQSAALSFGQTTGDRAVEYHLFRLILTEVEVFDHFAGRLTGHV
jgi:hypothetical protein